MNNRIIIIILLLLCMSSFSLKAIADDGKEKAELLRKLNNTLPDDTTRLELCYKLKNLANNSQVELYYINRLMKDAERLKHNRYRCLAYLGRMTLAYNNYDVDEVDRWMQRLEPIAESEKFYDYLFSGQRCVVDMLMVKGEYEREEKEAEKMLQRAESVNSKIGMVLAYQCLSNVYLMTYRYEEAVSMKKKAYEIAVDCDIDLAMEINSSVVQTYEGLGDRKSQMIWMKKMDDLLERTIRQNPAIEESYAIWISMNLVSYLKYYTIGGDLEKAAACMKKLDKYMNIGYETFMVSLRMARYRYFQQAKMLDAALKEVDELIQINKKHSSLSAYVSMVYLKASLLSQMGKEDQAISMYKRNLWLSDSVNIVLLNKQTDQIKADYRADTLLLKKENIHWNMQCLFLGLVLIVIVVLIFFVVHTKRTQRKLTKSEKEMRLMAEQMEQANEAKEKFLSTISSSINIPLNVVVTESLRLASDEVTDAQERSGISQKLNKTSAELMKLINNILNLSKLEAGMMKFREEDLEVVSFVQNIISVKKYEGFSVTLVLPEPIESWMVHIDAERLQEVFSHVLTVASPDVELTLEVKLIDKTELQFVVVGSVLAVHTSDQTQEEAIGNEVCRLTIMHFGGTYETVSADHPGIIRFTLPVAVK